MPRQADGRGGVARRPRRSKQLVDAAGLCNDQRTEIVTLGSGKVRSYDLEGNLLWWFAGMSSITIATPYADHGLLYVSSGYVGDRHRPLYAIRAGASGDISLEPDQTGNQWIAWCNPQAAPYNPTTLLYDGRLYVLYDRGLVSCYRSLTGEPVYERQRLPDGRHFTTSPWAYDGKVFCLNEDGVTFVVRGRRVRTAAHERTGRRRHVHGDAGDCRRPAARPHLRASLLHPAAGGARGRLSRSAQSVRWAMLKARTS